MAVYRQPGAHFSVADPLWNSAVIDQVDLGLLSLTGHDGILITVWLGISIMVFSFNFSPTASSLPVVFKREEYEKDFGRDFTERKCSQIISRASMLMVAVVMFFAFSLRCSWRTWRKPKRRIFQCFLIWLTTLRP